MAGLPNPENQGDHAMTRDLKWSHAEKGIARKAYERALDREFQAVIRTAKEMAGKIEQPADHWDLESYLTKSRREIDRKYDYRYSVLIEVFGKLVREGRLRGGRIAWSRGGQAGVYSLLRQDSCQV
jgi:hypothetical protein